MQIKTLGFMISPDLKGKGSNHKLSYGKALIRRKKRTDFWKKYKETHKGENVLWTGL